MHSMTSASSDDLTRTRVTTDMVGRVGRPFVMRCSLIDTVTLPQQSKVLCNAKQRVRLRASMDKPQAPDQEDLQESLCAGAWRVKGRGLTRKWT